MKNANNVMLNVHLVQKLTALYVLDLKIKLIPEKLVLIVFVLKIIMLYPVLQTV